MTKQFDNLFAAIAEPGAKPAQLVEMLSVEGLSGKTEFPSGAAINWNLVGRFRKLSQAARFRAALHYLTSHTTSETFAETHAKRIAKQPKIYRAFLHDQWGPTGAYDVESGAYAAMSDDTGVVYWEAIAPMRRMAVFIPVFKHLKEIPTALIKLAAGLGLAFRVSLKDIPTASKHFGCVLMPVGDRRAESLAADLEKAHETEGVPYGTALLFESGNVEENGVLMDTGDRYGLLVRRVQFYAIEIATDLGFTTRPRIS